MPRSRDSRLEPRSVHSGAEIGGAGFIMVKLSIIISWILDPHYRATCMIFQQKLLGAETDDLEPRSVPIRAEMGGAEIIMFIATL